MQVVAAVHAAKTVAGQYNDNHPIAPNRHNSPETNPELAPLCQGGGMERQSTQELKHDAHEETAKSSSHKPFVSSPIGQFYPV